MMIASRNGMVVSKPLPYDAEVEYLESTGTQYIDTGILPVVGYTYDFVVSTTGSYFAIFGASTVGGYLQITQGASAKWVLYHSGAVGNIDLSLSAGNVYHFQFGPSDLKVNDVQKSGYFGTNAVSYPIFLFARDYSGNADMKSSHRMHSFKVLNGNTVIADFKPVRFTNELGVSEGAMYDRANPTVGMNPDGSPRTDGLYRNQGTGAFLWEEKEGEIPAEYRQVQYIIKDDSSSSTVGLCMYHTGIYNDSAWHLETDGYNTAEASGWVWFGANYTSGFWQGYGFCGNYGSCRAVHGGQYSGYWTGIGTGGGGNVLKCDVTSTGTSIDWNGTVKSITSSAGFNNAEIYLMGNGVEYSVANGAGLGETVITQGGIKVAHLYPCVRLSDNAHVFYDTIQKVVREKVGTAATRVVDLS